MTDFNRKVEDASARVGQTIGEAAERLEKEIPEFIKYLNDEVVPAVRTHSTKALRVASQKLTEFADYMEQHQPPAQVAHSGPFAGTPRRRARFVHVTMLLIVLITILFLSGCGHPKPGARQRPTAPAAGVNA